MKSTPLKNIIANFGSRAWGLIALYFFTPIYTDILGLEYYSVLAFNNVLFGIVVFADAGISSAIDREFAKSGHDSYKLGLLSLFEKIYVVLCSSAGLAIFLGSDFIASEWLKTQTIPSDELSGYIKLIAIGVAMQLLPFIYCGALMGSQRQVSAGLIQFFWQLLRSVVGVFILLYIKRELSYFLVWQIVCNVIFVFVARYTVRSGYKNLSYEQIGLRSVPKEIWKYLGGMFLIAVVTALNVQVDKILTSKLFNLEQFGYYSLVSILAQLPYVIAIPIVLATFPLMTRSFSENNSEALYSIFKKASAIVSIIIIPVSSVLLLYGSRLFLIWQNNLSISSSEFRDLNHLMVLLIIANTFLGLQQSIFYLFLAKGKTRYTIIQSVFQLLIIVPAMWISIVNLGFVGAGLPPLFLNMAGLIFLMIIIKKELPQLRIMHYLLSTIIVPLTASLVVSGSVYLLIWFQLGAYSLIFLSLFSGCASVYLGLLLYNRLNKERITLNNLF